MATLVKDDPFRRLGAEVPVGEIDRRLSGFFDPGENNPAGITRASLLNLAVYNEDTDSLEDSAALIERLTRETACRAILVLAPPGGERGVRAWIEAHCRLDDQGEKTVCTEQVSFLLTGADASLVRNTVFAHLDSDLPLVFWWRGELSDIFEERLYGRVDRFVFDSRDWTHPAAPFHRLQSAMDEGGGFIPHDLAYTRVNPLRAAIARAFDDPRARAAIRDLAELEIEHRSGDRQSALWLAAWVAGRLGLSIDREKSTRDRVVADGLSIRLFPADPTCAGREAVPRVAFRGDDRERAFACTIHRCAESGLWRVEQRFGDSDTAEEWLPGGDRDDGDLITEILTRAGRNRAMLGILPTLRELLTLG